MRTWIQQPVGSRICGQIAVAVITGVPLEIAIDVVGRKRNSTRTIDLAKALRVLGYDCPDRCRKMPRPPLGIGHLTDPKRPGGWHWVVVDGDKIWDGSWGKPDGTAKWKRGWKITSYLPVTPRTDT